MESYKRKLKAEIIKKYGSVNEWTKEKNVSPERFYNFLKGEYNPTIETLQGWLDSVGLQIVLKKR